MNKRKTFRLRERDGLLSILPALSPKKTDALLNFLDAELNCDGPLDKETLVSLFDQASMEPLRREIREKLFWFLRASEERHSKTRVVSLVRDAILVKIIRFNPYTENSIGKSIMRDMLP